MTERYNYIYCTKLMYSAKKGLYSIIFENFNLNSSGHAEQNSRQNFITILLYYSALFC